METHDTVIAREMRMGEPNGYRSIQEVVSRLSVDELGADLHDLCAELYPVCRSITGDGVRRTLDVIRQRIPLEIREVASGTPVFDWTVPREWNVRDAYVADADGDRVIDFQRSNLHLVGYSVPVRRRMPLAELREHLHTLPDRPDVIPYRTSYYSEDWGFCLTHRQLEHMPDGEYEVVIDTTLEDGSLTYGECLVEGSTTDEILLTCHVCHPSMCNDNLSGIAVATAVAAYLREVPLRHSVRVLFIPGTIGSITWLARNEPHVERIEHGLVLTGLGDRGALTYKRSRRGDTPVDRAATHVLGHRGDRNTVIDFHPYGYDERQFCSPGFDLPVGRLSRTPHGEYPEYHTSADDLNFVTGPQMADAAAAVLEIVDVLERDGRYVNLNPKCEPQLGKRGLYRSVGGSVDSQAVEMAFLWVLNLSDGSHSLLDIAERSGLAFPTVRAAADALAGADLLRSDGPDEL